MTDKWVIEQAQDSQYKSSWRSPPSASHSGFGLAMPSSKAASSPDRQYLSKSTVHQHLLQEDAIRRSGVSGPLGMGVVMQSTCCWALTAQLSTRLRTHCCLADSLHLSSHCWTRCTLTQLNASSKLPSYEASALTDQRHRDVSPCCVCFKHPSNTACPLQ